MEQQPASPGVSDAGSGAISGAGNGGAIGTNQISDSESESESESIKAMAGLASGAYFTLNDGRF